MVLFGIITVAVVDLARYFRCWEKNNIKSNNTRYGFSDIVWFGFSIIIPSLRDLVSEMQDSK